jgi:hypothetical protein
MIFMDANSKKITAGELGHDAEAVLSLAHRTATTFDHPRTSRRGY